MTEHDQNQQSPQNDSEPIVSENIDGANAAPDANAEAAPEGQETPSPQEEELDILRNKNQELQDKYLRLYADFENFRRNAQKEKYELITSGNKQLIVELLPVIDDLERAMDAQAKTDNLEALRDGVTIILAKFQQLLEKQGVKAIEAVGAPFDAELHEVITTIPAPDPAAKGTVFDQIQKGYQYNDKVIRYAKVVVAE